MLYEELSASILKAYFNVLKELGTGFLESVYEISPCSQCTTHQLLNSNTIKSWIITEFW